tara:strand:+ start:374 stop:754 length:381 start_codon:yes stop_codon:yes gene_type:complete
MNIKVIAALIKNKDKVLIGRRSPFLSAGGMWEFPGGKLETTESHEECIKRELKEELEIDAKIGKLFTNYLYDYLNISYDLWFYEIESYQGELKCNVHDKLKWIKPDEHTNYNLLPGDIPIFEKMMK